MADIAPWIVSSARFFVSFIMGLMAIVHALWACSVWWPAHDEDQLVASVVGARGADRMPGAVPCLVVAAGLTVAAALPWLPQRGILGQWGGPIAALLAVIFAIRAALIVLPAWRRATDHQPFTTLDRRLYVPVSVLLAVSFWILSTV